MDPSPSLHAFTYDPFQQRAIDVIDRDTSLFVSAPTGSGKTVIADYVIAKTLREGRQVIYTAPVKALSNQKFREFTARVGEQVGIMTGDVTLNPTASILIMTTEIYRNTLLENSHRLARCAWVIFDEIHYLDDPERGTVWEEAILFTPPHINLLALSATIPNVEELAEWIRRVHERPVEVVLETHRPVPLQILYQCQNTILDTAPKLKREGYLNREDWSGLSANTRRWGGGRHMRHRRPQRREDHFVSRPNRLDALIRHLQETDRLPCIFFTFGRRRTEDLALEASGLPLVSPAERDRLRELFSSLRERYHLSDDRTTQALAHLIERGVAYHHAGMLPTTKEVVEQCFVSRMVKFIVTTETFALGINMPARSVVLDTVKKRFGDRVDLLRTRQFQQMAGRAGRRGLDPAGFVYLRINPSFVTYPEVMRVLHNPPEKVESRLNTGYATLLNLYQRHGRKLLDLFPKTFYAFQTSGARRDAGLSAMERKLDLLEQLDYVDARGLRPKGEFALCLYGYELLLTELHDRGLLDDLDPPALAVLLSAAVYEPRPGLRLVKSNRLSKRLEELCQVPLMHIHQAERAHRVKPLSKAPQFQLAAAMEAWFHGAPFAQLLKLSEVDEGEIVRYFRMTVQLLRQLMETRHADPSLHRKASLALQRVNRDVVDAEQQLRLG
ncbi:MAG: DEAD/DEAH box helicase [Candidatus Omnitrophica bacterium]|nr:DEAD/DEAH box helicase [Candidatus Omnitrophota bacterium]